MSELAYEMGYRQALRDLCKASPDLVNEICQDALVSGEAVLERRLSDVQAEMIADIEECSDG